MKTFKIFRAFFIEPSGMIAHNFSNLKEAQDYMKKLSTKHWTLYGTTDNDLVLLYEEQNGIIIKNEFD